MILNKDARSSCDECCKAERNFFSNLGSWGIDISIKLVIIEYENNFRDGGCHGKAAVSDGYHQYQVRQFF